MKDKDFATLDLPSSSSVSSPPSKLNPVSLESMSPAPLSNSKSLRNPNSNPMTPTPMFKPESVPNHDTISIPNLESVPIMTYFGLRCTQKAKTFVILHKFKTLNLKPAHEYTVSPASPSNSVSPKP